MICRAGVRAVTGVALLGYLSGALATPVVVTDNADSSSGLDSGSRSPASEASRAKTVGAYAKVPLHFEVNAGQEHDAVKFGSRGRGYQLFLTGKETVLVLQRPRTMPADEEARLKWMTRSPRERERDAAQAGPESAAVLRISFDGANTNPEVIGESPLPGKSHYFNGNDPAKWRTNVAHYAAVRYRSVYPGVDMVYYGSEGRLEYDWLVAPGTDPHRIVEVFDGATQLNIDANGDLLIKTAVGGIWQKKPDMYQEIAGNRIAVDGSYVVLGDNRVGFKVGRYDVSLPLVIDPVLQYSTYLGGTAFDSATAAAVSPIGEAYIVGQTASFNFPAASTFGFFSGSGTQVAFVTKLNAAGNAIVYSAFIGSSDRAVGIGLGADGSAYIGGTTSSSSNFPVTGFIGPTTGVFSTFVVKLAPDGSALTYSTLIGASRGAQAASFAVDPAGSAYVVGITNASDFPVTPGAFQTTNPNNIMMAYVAKLTPDGTQLAYGTLFGDPSANPTGPTQMSINSLAVDAAGNAYFAGSTVSPNLPLANAYQGVLKGQFGNGFFTKFNASGTALIYSSYLGGSVGDLFNSIAVDSQGNAYLTGQTSSPDFPSVNALPGAYGNQTAMVVKLDPSGTVIFSTPLGSGRSVGFGITPDRVGNIYVAGFATAPFPAVNDLGRSGAGIDVFLSKIAPDLRSLLFSTRIGGGGEDIAFGVAVDAVGGAYVAGRTTSRDFPVADPVQPSFGAGGFDAFVLKVFDPIAPVVLLSSKNPSTFGDPVTFTAIVTLSGATGTVTFRDGSAVLATAPLNSSGAAVLTLSTLSVANNHSITAAYSGDANNAAVTSSVLVQFVNPLPQDTVTTLSAGSTTVPANQAVALTATVTGTTGSTPIGTVIFFDGASTLGTATLISGIASFNASIPTGGQHSLTTRYNGDVLSKPSVSAPLAITILGPPTVSVSAPANNSVFEYPATVGITAIASSPPGTSVVKVDLLLNAAPLATFTAPPYTFAWANAPPGVYRLAARAVDNFGQATVSAPVQVQIHLQGTTYYHHDLQGNVIATTDSFGAAAYTESYQPFGGRLVGDPAGQVAQANGNRLWFHGKAQDESTGLSYFGARYYDPAIGRFMGVDAAGFAENNIHSFNRYAYANNNPLKYTDPNGHQALEVNLVLVGATVGADAASGQPFGKLRLGLTGIGLFYYPSSDFSSDGRQTTVGDCSACSARADSSGANVSLGVNAGLGSLVQFKASALDYHKEVVNVEQSNGQIATHFNDRPTKYLKGEIKFGLSGKGSGESGKEPREKAKTGIGVKLSADANAEWGAQIPWSRINSNVKSERDPNF